jgi:hypothetical protein
METGCPVLAYTEFPPPDTIEFFSDSASVSCSSMPGMSSITKNENERERDVVITLSNMSQLYKG